MDGGGKGWERDEGERRKLMRRDKEEFREETPAREEMKGDAPVNK